MTIEQLSKAAPLLNLAQLSRIMYGEQANPSYWSRRLLEGSPEISPGEAKQIRQALEPINQLLNDGD